MSHSTNPIQPDVIVNTIRELQQEKSRQEKTLNDLWKTRTQLERKNEIVMRDVHMAKEKNDKLMETLKIAQHKLEQSQNELDCQQGRNQELESKIEMLGKEIEHEKDRQQKEVEDFQTKLAQIADKFIQARKYYMEDNMDKEVTIMKKRTHGLEHKAIGMKHEAEKLAEQLSKLQLERDMQIKSAEHSGITLELQHQILQMFLDEKSSVEAYQNDLAVKGKDFQDQVLKHQDNNKDLETTVIKLEGEVKSKPTWKADNCTLSH